jgi:hypothetical protein
MSQASGKFEIVCAGDNCRVNDGGVQFRAARGKAGSGLIVRAVWVLVVDPS